MAVTPPEHLTVTGARENNLRDVSVAIPKRQITAFVGVSGSGKSSLVFDTIAAEAQRQLNETFSAFVRGFLPKLGQPDADLIENLSTADRSSTRSRLGGGSPLHAGHGHRHPLAAAAAVLPALQPHVGYGNAFSFNDPRACAPTCAGIGRKMPARPRRDSSTCRSR